MCRGTAKPVVLSRPESSDGGPPLVGRGRRMLLTLCGHSVCATRSTLCLCVRSRRNSYNIALARRYGKNHRHNLAESLLYGLGADFNPWRTDVLASGRSRVSAAPIRTTFVLVGTRSDCCLTTDSFGLTIVDWLAEPARELFSIQWKGNLLTSNYLLATGVWLAGVYAYLYSDIVVRKVGVYLALAGVCLVMAEATLLLGFDIQAEWIIAAMAVTSVLVNCAHRLWPHYYKNMDRFVQPLGWILGIVPALWGAELHFRATSAVAVSYGWDYPTSSEFIAVMLITTLANRVNAYLCRHTDPKSSAVYLFVSAASLMLAAAGLLRVLGLTIWSQQAPWMMLIPIGYLIASRFWRGHTAERPLYWVAQTATTVILVHVFAATLDNLQSFAPMVGLSSSLMLGLVFAEAALFYLLAAILRQRSINVYLAAAAACGSVAVHGILRYR